MKGTMKEILTEWRWKGNKLVHPLTIVRRLLAWPFYLLAKCFVFITVLAGWGYRDACYAWKELN